RSRSVIVWALAGWVKSATRAEALRPSVGQAGEAAEVGQAHRVRRREAVSREGAAVFLRRAPAPAVRTRTMRAWTLYGTSAGNWACRSIFTSRTPSGPTSRWTGRTTVS